MKTLVSLVIMLLLLNLSVVSGQSGDEFDVYYDIQSNITMQPGVDITLDDAGDIYVLENEHVPGTCTVGSEGSYCLRITITKIDVQTNTVVYTFHLTDGTSSDTAEAIAVDGVGSVYIVGLIHGGSSHPPTVPLVNAFDSVHDGYYDAFLSKLNPAGDTVLYSTYIGGSDVEVGYDVAVNNTGVAYVTGITKSSDFPVLNAFQDTQNGDYEAFMSVIDTAQIGAASLVYSTYLGGAGREQGHAIATDGLGNVYITGKTQSTDMPLLSPYQTSLAGGKDIFVIQIDATKTGSASFIYGTYFGGTGDDFVLDIGADTSGSVVFTGQTMSDDFPLANAFQPVFRGGTIDGFPVPPPHDGFVTKLDLSNNSLTYSTYLGGSGSDTPAGITVHDSGTAYVTGSTWSADFPTRHAYQNTFGGYVDAFVTAIDPAGQLLYSTYHGGIAYERAIDIAVSQNGFVYIVGEQQDWLGIPPTPVPLPGAAAPMARSKPAAQDADLTGFRFGLRLVSHYEPRLSTNATISAINGRPIILDNSLLEAVDADTPTWRLYYAVTMPPGQGELSAGRSFTQWEVDSGALVYTTPGTTDSFEDSFQFTLSDGVSLAGPYTFTIDVVGESFQVSDQAFLNALQQVDPQLWVNLAILADDKMEIYFDADGQKGKTTITADQGHGLVTFRCTTIINDAIPPQDQLATWNARIMDLVRAALDALTTGHYGAGYNVEVVDIGTNELFIGVVAP